MGQTFLSALVDVRRQECPRHSAATSAMTDRWRNKRSWRYSALCVCGSPVTPRSGVTGTARPTLRFAVPYAFQTRVIPFLICANLRNLRLKILPLRLALPCGILYRELVPWRRAGCFGTGASGCERNSRAHWSPPSPAVSFTTHALSNTPRRPRAP